MAEVARRQRRPCLTPHRRCRIWRPRRCRIWQPRRCRMRRRPCPTSPLHHISRPRRRTSLRRISPLPRRARHLTSQHLTLLCRAETSRCRMADRASQPPMLRRLTSPPSGVGYRADDLHPLPRSASMRSMRRARSAGTRREERRRRRRTPSSMEGSPRRARQPHGNCQAWLVVKPSARARGKVWLVRRGIKENLCSADKPSSGSSARRSFETRCLRASNPSEEEKPLRNGRSAAASCSRPCTISTIITISAS